ncbi:uncharacterized protein EI97DRAFT_472183 [Westerdykella ornata]|uniref:Uncharacterized protein n=1 Tax=Westerdykella ornata TaxID=318751 RepID=A0A6A6JYT0_WESOR|nr:uncharacterized protein EI97DRAFT_472183 [Westerdykella ornata]KAF2281008.1 hypothetical protein EI97DRAFT_472183 [Westerdykella ornata]
MRNFRRRLSETSLHDEGPQTERPAKRRPNVYDAIAGRVTDDGVIYPNRPSTVKPKTKVQPLRPDEILYKARKAPVRYDESDHYFAHANLPEDQGLPSGELLTALHAYISNFYARSQRRVNQKVWKSMDETALIALGILIEETTKEILGETGDFVFTEGMEEGEEEAEADDIVRQRIRAQNERPSEARSDREYELWDAADEEEEWMNEEPESSDGSSRSSSVD